MNMAELIAAYGGDKVAFQNLDQCADTVNMTKKCTKITFGTEEKVTLKGTERLGLVLWLDRERVAEILAESRAKEPPKGDAT